MMPKIVDNVLVMKPSQQRLLLFDASGDFWQVDYLTPTEPQLPRPWPLALMAGKGAKGKKLPKGKSKGSVEPEEEEIEEDDAEEDEEEASDADEASDAEEEAEGEEATDEEGILASSGFVIAEDSTKTVLRL